MRISLYHRFQPILIATGMAFALIACTSMPGTNQDTGNSGKRGTLEEALQLKDDGRVADAAGMLLQMSEHSMVSERPQYMFEAAQLYLQVPDLVRAADVLKKLQLTAQSSSYATILDAQLTLRNGNAIAALSQLKQAPTADTISSAKAVYWLTLAEALESSADNLEAPNGAASSAAQLETKNGKTKTAKAKVRMAAPLNSALLNAVQARIKAEEFLVSTHELAKNQDAIWRLLTSQSATTLKSLKTRTKDASVKAWLDLATLAKDAKGAVRESDINTWRKKYPNLVVLNQRLLELRGVDLDKIRHVALILPTKSTSLGTSAKAVWDGFQAAQKRNLLPYPIKLYETDANPTAALNAYKLAVEKGAALIVGPLPRKSLSLLADRHLLPVPTIALNVIDDEKLPVNFYQFGLPVTQEARLIARAAKEKGFTEAAILKGANALDMRSSEAFIQEWTLLQGTFKTDLAIKDTAAIDKLASTGLSSNTMIFIAADFPTALATIKAAPSSWTLFGTSALNTSSPEAARIDKNKKIYFVDVPALVKAATPGEEITVPVKDNVVYSRLYSLGVDVCRLSTLLLRDDMKFNRMLINGATGELRVSRNGKVERDLPLVSLQEASLSGYRANDLVRLSDSPQK